MLFDNATRVSTQPSRHSESRFHFYNRIAGPVWNRIRAVLEDWYTAFPAEGRDSVLQRIRSGNNREFSSAFWELYLARALSASGCRLTLHPAVPGTTRHPEFLVEPPIGEPFYLEGTIATPPADETGRSKRLGVLYDLINDVPSPDFFVSLEIEREGRDAPPTKRLRTELLGWFAALDADQLRQQSARDLESHALVWESEEWRLRFVPIPKTSGVADPADPTIGIYPGESGFIDTKGPIRRAVRDKAGRYGVPDRPLVIAVLAEHVFIDLEDVHDALFGSIAVSVPVRPSGPERARAVRRRDGVLVSSAGPVWRRVSAVLAAINLHPGSLLTTRPRLWLNPWALRPLNARMPWPVNFVDPDTGTVTGHLDGVASQGLFGLPADWPGPEPRFP